MTAVSDETGREREALIALVREFICEFWIDKPTMKWRRTLCDDGVEMVHHEGDTIFFGDPNHREPPDTKRFDLIVQLANSAPALLHALSATPVAQEPVARLVPIKNLVAMLALLPPAPVDVNGEQFAYHDPNAAERLLELRSVFDALIAASPLYTSPPATPAGVGVDEIARAIKHDLLKKDGNHGCLIPYSTHLDSFIIRGHVDLMSLGEAILALLSRAGDQK